REYRHRDRADALTTIARQKLAHDEVCQAPPAKRSPNLLVTQSLELLGTVRHVARARSEYRNVLRELSGNSTTQVLVLRLDASDPGDCSCIDGHVSSWNWAHASRLRSEALGGGRTTNE